MDGISLLGAVVQVQVPAVPADISGGGGAICLWVTMAVGVLALVAAWMLARHVLCCDTGTPAMQSISNAIREGAEAFLRRQYKTIGVIAFILAILLFAGYHMSARTAPFARQSQQSLADCVARRCGDRAGGGGAVARRRRRAIPALWRSGASSVGSV